MCLRAAGQLHHSNIVPVFEVGEDSGLHYYAMQFIHGENLDLVIEEIKRLRTNSQATGVTVSKSVSPAANRDSPEDQRQSHARLRRKQVRQSGRPYAHRR